MLNLVETVKQGPRLEILHLTERLPRFLISPCIMRVSYHAEVKDNVYLLHLDVSGVLNVICQRCMENFAAPYQNKTTLAVCADETEAQRLLENYEPIVAPRGQVNLEDLTIDELYLYAPSFHPMVTECDERINNLLI